MELAVARARAGCCSAQNLYEFCVLAAEGNP